MEDEFSKQEIDAPFNMALATLKRLDTILQNLRQVSLMSINPKEKQRMNIDLLKQFYLNSIPLLDNDYIKENNDKILNLKLNKSVVAKSGGHKNLESYDQELENNINKFFIEIQQKLKKYFMPKGKDPGKAIEF